MTKCRHNETTTNSWARKLKFSGKIDSYLKFFVSKYEIYRVWSSTCSDPSHFPVLDRTDTDDRTVKKPENPTGVENFSTEKPSTTKTATRLTNSTKNDVNKKILFTTDFTVTTKPLKSSDNENKGSSAGLIIGCIVVIAMIAVVVGYVIKKRRAERNSYF